MIGLVQDWCRICSHIGKNWEPVASYSILCPRQIGQYTESNRSKYRCMHGHRNRHRQAEGQVGRRTGRQARKQAGRHILAAPTWFIDAGFCTEKKTAVAGGLVLTSMCTDLRRMARYNFPMPTVLNLTIPMVTRTCVCVYVLCMCVCVCACKSVDMSVDQGTDVLGCRGV